jgi:hypothetical protein
MDVTCIIIACVPAGDHHKDDLYSVPKLLVSVLKLSSARLPLLLVLVHLNIKYLILLATVL